MKKPFDVNKLLESSSAEALLQEPHDTPRAGPSPFSPPIRALGVNDSQRASSLSEDAHAAVPPPQYDPVNQPRHYNVHPSGVECIEITEWMNFNLGNCIKYIWRADEKGATIEDLKKARWYLDREIDRLGRLSK